MKTRAAVAWKAGAPLTRFRVPIRKAFFRPSSATKALAWWSMWARM